MERQKKPLWKKWWFWIIVVVVLLIIVGTAGGSDKDMDKKKEIQSTDADTASTQDDNTDTKDINERQEDKQTENQGDKDSYGPGEPAAMKDVTVTLESVTENKGKQYNEPAEGNVFLLCEFTIDNQSEKELAVSSIMSFDAYVDSYAVNQSITGLITDEGNKQLDGTVAPGKKMNGVIAYEVPEDWKEFEVNFEPDMWSGKKLTFIYQK
ncbi:DUF4352 domain-containing protein [Diplocloster modestus]|uniref:DUF4352 domain-containing protein n=1 Tax=Diplocloster modestus TaxID=2850322 RepID=A0ABS6KD17_9FIRM|nr:DUF4352 domain-containing protein [Diplocloster modestus]MBU9728396.1 DUF4352 domain-containing protein [Diplocloster modestus]